MIIIFELRILNFSLPFYSDSPAELQFYPNLAAVALQLPTWYFLVDFNKLSSQMNSDLALAILMDGISFHGQTITAYVLMSYVNPVTYRYVCRCLLFIILFVCPSVFKIYNILLTY